MPNTRVPRVAAIFVVVGLLAVTACGGTTAANSPSTTATVAPAMKVAPLSSRPTPGGTPTGPVTGSVTPTGPVRVGDWMMTVHGAQAYPKSWTAPAGMPGRWGDMGPGHIAVVLDVSAQYLATPAPGAGTAYAGPRCRMRGGWGMMGPKMNDGAYGWKMLAAGSYRGPMAYRAPTSVRRFTLRCTDPATGSQASWHIGF